MIFNIIIFILVFIYYNNRTRKAREEILKWASNNNFEVINIKYNFFNSIAHFRIHLAYDVTIKEGNTMSLIGLDVGGLYFTKYYFEDFHIDYKKALNDNNL